MPDFTQAGLRFTNAAREMQQQFERINTVPAIQLQQIMNQLTQLTQAVNRLEAKIENHNNNNMARLQNSFATSSTDPLAPLHYPITDVVIPNLPIDSDSITRLTSSQIRDILQDLGVTVLNNQGGGVAFLRRQLRIHMGLRADQAHGA